MSQKIPFPERESLLSIIIPTLNASKTIERCLASIQVQTFRDFEVLIQDGGSTDDTLATVRDVESGSGHLNIKVQQRRDRGLYDAMNIAVERARGKRHARSGTIFDERDGLLIPATLRTGGCSIVRASHSGYGPGLTKTMLGRARTNPQQAW